MESTLYKHAAKNGGILSGITIALVAIIYVANTSFLASLTFLAILILLSMGYTVYAGISYRKEIGGYITFGKAYVYGLLLMVISGAIGTLFNILLYHVIDPDLPQIMMDAIAGNMEEMMRNFGAPESKIDEALDQMRRDMPQQFTAVGQLIGFAKIILWYAGFALITSLIVKKSQPVEV